MNSNSNLQPTAIHNEQNASYEVPPPVGVYQQQANPKSNLQYQHDPSGLEKCSQVMARESSNCSAALILLISGMIFPILLPVNVCLHIKSKNPKDKKYAKISLILFIIQVVLSIAIIIVYAVMFQSTKEEFSDRYNDAVKQESDRISNAIKDSASENAFGSSFHDGSDINDAFRGTNDFTHGFRHLLSIHSKNNSNTIICVLIISLTCISFHFELDVYLLNMSRLDLAFVPEAARYEYRETLLQTLSKCSLFNFQ